MDGLRKAMGLEEPQGAEENTASFEIYPTAQDSTAAELAGLRAQLLNHLLPFMRGYIWQRDRFSLQLSTDRQAPWQRARAGASGQRRRGSTEAAALPPPPHLWGSLGFGDNVEDEWFVVWLLLELTRTFPVTARVWDNDGEFLLIEAAYGLPRWLKPETAQNRVWLHGGTFHLMPLPRSAGDPLLPASPSLAQALVAVRSGQVDTAAPPKMQAALLPRVSGFPQRAAQLMHVAHALLPARVAQLVGQEPQLVAAAVEAFHYRTPDDVRVASKMAAFPPSDLVMAAPVFSRCLYAQLALQEYAPPRSYPMPMPTDPQYKAAEVGLKLTAGFEMMFANRARFGRQGEQEEEGANKAAEGAHANGGETEESTAGGAGSSSIATSEASLAGDAGWQAFKARLQASGYFQGALPGSALHTQQLHAAVASYRGTEAYMRGTAALAAPALAVDALLAQPLDLASFPPASQLPPEGSEAWLQEQAGQQLEAELQQRQQEQEQQAQHAKRKQGRQSAAAGARAATGAGTSGSGGGEGGEFDAGELAGRLRAFVDMMAGLEGAEVPEGGSAGGKAGKAGTATGAAGSAATMALDEAAFAAELEKVLGLTAAAAQHAQRAQHTGDEHSVGSSSSDEGSSFFSDDGGSSRDEMSEDGEGEGAPWQQAQHEPQQAQHQPQHKANGKAAMSEDNGEEEEERRQQEGWEAGTATDSDDEGGAFMAAYGAAMDKQLAGTRMADSFERAPAPPAATPAVGAAAANDAVAAEGDSGAAEAGTEAAEGVEEEGAGAALRPVDLDFNLVSSLLASYDEQQGLPGPAGSLAGLMGLQLPPSQARR